MSRSPLAIALIGGAAFARSPRGEAQDAVDKIALALEWNKVIGHSAHRPSK
jgi:hypothetical protein